MTTPKQKTRERFFVEQAIHSLRVEWRIAGRELPDFIVKQGDRQFGLEVSEIFAGVQDPAGSEMKRTESKTQRMLDALRAEYERTAPIPLRVKFVGRIETDTLASVVQSLLDLDFATKPIAFQTVIDMQRGLRIHVTKGYRSEWISVMDRVGWVDRNPQKIIADAVKAKSKKLPEYQAAAGPDVRLLLVANAIQNSGKLRADDEHPFDLHGFEVVYFFPYPEDVVILSANQAGDILP